MNDRLIPLTNDRGALLVQPEDAIEPEQDSIILTEGLHGTAWQRHADGQWHSTNRRTTLTWDQLLNTHRNLVLVYDAEPREDLVKTRRAKVRA